MKPIAAIIVGFVGCVSPSDAAPPLWAPDVGDVFEIRQEYQTEDKSDDGGSGSSSGHTTIIERVLALREDGMELEYDLPTDSSDQDRTRQWQFPARIFRPYRGSLKLLNEAELESRIEAWLKLGNMGRDACGKWIFTWNAFKIECDPQSVISHLEPYNLWIPDLREGGSYREPRALAAAPLKASDRQDPATYVAEMKVDPDAIRRERAEADVVVSEIMGKPVSQASAEQARSAEEISGTITVTFKTDASGKLKSRTTQVLLKIKEVGGKTETQWKTENVERSLIPR